MFIDFTRFRFGSCQNIFQNKFNKNIEKLKLKLQK